MSNGVVIYRGPSEIDGASILVVATGFTAKSANWKLGQRMFQTWILCEDISPIDAVVTGKDNSICGSCILRGVANGQRVENRKCYVPVYYAPYSIWKCYRNKPSILRSEIRSLFSGHGVRLGAYGDPAAVPSAIWEEITAKAAFWTGYTHQWRTCDPIFAQWCMASCDNVAEREIAKSLGYRTFRITDLDARHDRLSHEIVCPASSEMGHKTTCEQCRMCNGTSGNTRVDVAITSHGNFVKQERRKRAANNLPRIPSEASGSI
jgi:hypothetical protein